MGVIKQQIDLAPRLIHRAAADPAVIAILVDEALPLGVDEYAIGMAFGHGPRAGGEKLVHVDRFTARTDAQFDACAIVLVTDGIVKLEGIGAVLAPHGLVEHKTAGGQHHALCRFDKARLVVDPHHQTDDPLIILDQGHGAGIGDHCHALGAGAGFKHIDQRPPAAPAHVLDHVAARGRLGLVAKRRCGLAAGPDQG